MYRDMYRAYYVAKGSGKCPRCIALHVSHVLCGSRNPFNLRAVMRVPASSLAVPLRYCSTAA